MGPIATLTTHCVLFRSVAPRSRVALQQPPCRRPSSHAVGHHRRARGCALRVLAGYDTDFDTESIRVPTLPKERALVAPQRQPQPPPPRPPPPPRGRPRAMPPNRRNIVFGVLAAAGAVMFTKATSGGTDEMRELLGTKIAMDGVQMMYDERNPGDTYFRSPNGQVYMIGSDGLRVDTNQDVWAERTNDDGDLKDLVYIGNLEEMSGELNALRAQTRGY